MKFLHFFALTLSTLSVISLVHGQFDGEGEDDYGGGPPMGMDGYDGGYGGYGGGGYGGGGYGGGGYGGGAPPMTELTPLESTDGVKDFVTAGANEVVVVGFFDEATNSADKEAFERVMKASGPGFKVGISTSKSVLEEMKYDGSAVLVYPPAKAISAKYEKARSRFPSKSIKEESLEKFVYEKALPLVGEKSLSTARIYDKTKLPTVTLFADNADLEKNDKQFQYYANRMRKVALTHKGKLVFNIASKSDYSYELDDYGLSLAEKTDVGVGIKAGSMYYKMTDSFSSDNFARFIEQYLAGSLTPKVKEEPKDEPEPVDDGEESPFVKTLTTANFKAEVLDNDKDALVEFYAPWCGHCKALKPKFANLAKTLSGVPSVVIGALDATANEVPKGFDVQGYPTLYFVKGNDKKNPISYEGQRDEKDMLKFIQEHASTKFSL